MHSSQPNILSMDDSGRRQKYCDNISEYNEPAKQGGHEDLRNIISGESNMEPMDEMGRRQKGCDNISVYNELARQGGHKDLLHMNDCSDTDTDTGRRQKGCDNLSVYNEMARQGGHKGLLSMSSGEPNIVIMDDLGRRQKGCVNISEYNEIALQGGHKDLLKIDAKETPPEQKRKTHSTRTYGDWYSDKNGVTDDNNTTSTSSSPELTPTPTSRDNRRGNGNCIVPDGEEEAPRCGKKIFDNTSQRQEAPFATYY